MGQIVKTYLGIFLMMLLTMLGIGMITAEVQIAKARNYKTDVVIELENSNYNQTVVEACRKQAENLGYTLDITLYDDFGGIYQADEMNQVGLRQIAMAEVLLKYQYKMGPFHGSSWHSIKGMAR